MRTFSCSLRKGRAHVQRGRVLRQTQHVAVEGKGRQRPGKAGAAEAAGEAAAQEGRGHQVADGERIAVAVFLQRGLEDRVLAERLGQPRELQEVEEALLKRALRLLRLRREVVAEGDHRLLQGPREGARDAVRGAVGLELRLLLPPPFAQQLAQRLLDERGCLAAHRAQRRGFELCAVHAPRAVQQVVRLVDQHGRAPFFLLGQRPQEGAAVEVVVVVADDGIAPAHQLLREEVGTDLMGQRDAPQLGAIQPGRAHGLGARSRQAVVEAARQRAGLAVAGLVRVLADLFARRQFQHAQRPASAVAQQSQAFQRDRAARGLGREEEELVDAQPAPGLEQREEGGDGLADAGGRLRQQAAFGHGRAIDRLGQLALAGPEARMRESQRVQRGIARRAVGSLLLGPGQVAAAQRLEVRAQGPARHRLGEHVLLVRAQVQVDQRHLETLQPARLAQHPRIAARLCPVQRAVVRANRVEVAAESLDLLQPAALRVVAVGPAAHLQAAEARAQAELAFVVRAAPALHQAMAGHAFLRAGCGHEAQVQVTGPGREGAQGLDRDRKLGAGHRLGGPRGGGIGGHAAIWMNIQ